MADDAKLAADKKQVAAENEARQKFYSERAKHAGRPTPTQEEADLLKLGNHIELSPDGSPPDPQQVGTKNMEAEHSSGGGYRTRHVAPAAPKAS